MKLDRNINPDGKGKYALLNLRSDTIEWGNTNSVDEFFVIKLKDQFAAPALHAYAKAARDQASKDRAHGFPDSALELEEWANEVEELARRAAVHPLKTIPD